MIYDCFTFFNDLDLLQIRLEEMAANVDWFVLAEAPLTFQGRHKPLYFQDNRHRFSKFVHKIRQIIVNDMPNNSAITPWDREYHQRNSLKKGLTDAADEMLREAAIKETMSRIDFIFFHVELFYYYLDWRAFECPWIKPYAAPWSIIRTMPDLTRPRAMERAYLTEIGRDPDTAIITRAGWHFSWLGGPNEMLEKLESFSHTEPEVAIWRDAPRLAEEIRRGRFFYSGASLTPVPVDDSFPTLVRTNQDVYRRKGLLSPSPDKGEPHDQRVRRMPVSADDVRNAYRFILGREPENAEAVAAHQSRAADLADLRRNFIESAEFQSKMASGALYRAKDDFMMSLSDLHFMTVLEQGRYRHPLSLSHHHAQVYSQNGEDGIIAEIFYRISVQDKFFVEIGTENGQQNNTRFLLEQGWRGAWVDSDFGDAHTTFANFINSGVLSLIEGSVTAENINALLDQRAVPAAFDFLSLDIDQNTSHVWRALQRRARVSCIEYNASIPASVALEAPYDPSARWDGTNWYGGSLKALEQIGAIKEMSLVGCELCGVNAFFVDKREAINRFREPFTAETHWEPPRYHLAAHTGHSPSKSARYWRLANG